MVHSRTATITTILVVLAHDGEAGAELGSRAPGHSCNLNNDSECVAAYGGARGPHM